VFIREVLPQDMKLEIAHLSREEAMSVAEFLAYVVGHGHARQLDGGRLRAPVTTRSALSCGMSAVLLRGAAAPVASSG
jgi:Uncharacterized protein conserved in bacteria (DUF2252)